MIVFLVCSHDIVIRLLRLHYNRIETSWPMHNAHHASWNFCNHLDSTVLLSKWNFVQIAANEPNIHQFPTLMVWCFQTCVVQLFLWCFHELTLLLGKLKSFYVEWPGIVTALCLSEMARETANVFGVGKINLGTICISARFLWIVTKEATGCSWNPTNLVNCTNSKWILR